MNCIAGQTPKFDFTLDFMEEKDLAKIKNVISKLDKIEETAEGKEIMQKLMKNFESIGL